MKEPAYRKPSLDASSGSSANDPVVIYRDEALLVTRVDYGTRDASTGFYDYIYLFSNYELVSGGVRYRARRYADTWDEVSLFSPEQGRWSAIPYDDAAFARAARYFLALDDVRRVEAFVGERMPVDPERLRIP